MMQRNGNFVGMPIGIRGAARFEEAERQMRLQRLATAAGLSNDDSPWFAVRCMTGRERSVNNALDDIGIGALVPMRKGPDLRRRHRLVEGQMMPVIHGYVLVQVASNPVFLDAMRGIEHVMEVLGGCLSPKRLKASEVKHFKDMADQGAYDWERPCELVVKAGDKVLITEGPFCRLSAMVVTPSRKGKGDVVVNVRILGGEVPVTVPLAILQML